MVVPPYSSDSSYATDYNKSIFIFILYMRLQRRSQGGHGAVPPPPTIRLYFMFNIFFIQNFQYFYVWYPPPP